MGNNRSEVELGIQLDKEFYYAGETLNGKLCINAKKKFSCSMIVLFIEGVEICEFQTEANIAVKGQNNLINTNYVLHQFIHGYKLDGQHLFPFSFKFLNHLPGSYSETRGYKAHIVYKLKAILQPSSKDSAPIENSIEIIIRQPQKDEQRMLFGECFAKCQSYGCCDKGISRVTCFVQKNFYFPSDECIVICEVDNLKCKLNMSRVNCQFIKEVTLTSATGVRRVFSQVLNVIQFAGAAAGEAYYGQHSQRNAIRLIYKDNNLGVHPTTNGKAVKCEYFILVKPEFSGCFVTTQQNEFKVKLNILQPAMIYEPIVQPDAWRPSVEANTNIFLDFNDKNELLSSMNDFKP